MANIDDNDANLEAVVRISGRPALLVQDGDFGVPPPEWEQLNAKRELLKAIFPSIGRLEIAETNRSCGTAFLVGDGVLMTNKHVLDQFAEPDGTDWRIRPRTTVRIDYREEHERPTPSELHVAGVLGVHSKYDLALLRVEASDDPKPLVLATTEPSPVRDRDVVVIGYPDLDQTATDAQVTVVFDDVLGVKRLQPGKTKGLRGNPMVLGHDCSTLGGNSGSCMIDLETGHVIALHYGGTTVSNLAVPLWTLTDDSLLRRFDLNWADETVPSPGGRRRRAARS